MGLMRAERDKPDYVVEVFECRSCHVSYTVGSTDRSDDLS
jgi:hypothetical protein